MSFHQVLVTGANGFIGHHLCKKLLEHKYDVIGLSRSKNPKNIVSLQDYPNFHIVSGDINNIPFLEDLFRKFEIDVIMHLAIASPLNLPPANHIQSSLEFKVNFSGTLNLLNAAHQAGVKNWIQSSTMSVFDFNNPQYLPVDENHPTHPTENYGFTKLLAENACNFFHKNHDFNMIILRYSGVYGNGKNNGLIAKFTRQCIEESTASFNASTNRTSDFVSVNDVVQANLLALEKISESQKSNSSLFQIFNIGSGEETSVYDAVNLIKKHTNSKITILKEISDNPRRFFFDCRKAINHLNYNPASVNDGIKEYIAAALEYRNSIIKTSQI